MRNKEIIAKLKGLNGTLNPTGVSGDSQKYWEGYRRALCEVAGEKPSKYPFYWEE